jgi:hypothetical protein
LNKNVYRPNRVRLTIWTIRPIFKSSEQGDTEMTLTREIEIWRQYGAYLIGVGAIARNHPNATFAQFLAACGHSRGGWADEALRKAWNGAR